MKDLLSQELILPLSNNQTSELVMFKFAVMNGCLFAL